MTHLLIIITCYLSVLKKIVKIVMPMYLLQHLYIRIVTCCIAWTCVHVINKKKKNFRGGFFFFFNVIHTSLEVRFGGELIDNGWMAATTNGIHEPVSVVIVNHMDESPSAPWHPLHQSSTEVVEGNCNLH